MRRSRGAALAHSGGQVLRQVAGRRASAAPPVGGAGRGPARSADPTMTPSAKAATSAAWARVETPEPDAHRGRRRLRACRATSVGGARRRRSVARAGDAHRRGGVDEARGRPRPSSAAARRSRTGATRKTRSRPCVVAGARSTPRASSGMRSGVISPAPPAAARSAGETRDAVPVDRVPVGHHQRRERPARGDLLDGARGRRGCGCPPRSAASTACWITGPSISGSEYGQRRARRRRRRPSTMRLRGGDRGRDVGVTRRAGSRSRAARPWPSPRRSRCRRASRRPLAHGPLARLRPASGDAVERGRTSGPPCRRPCRRGRTG